MMKSVILLVMTTLASEIWSVSGQALCDGTFGTNRAQFTENKMQEHFYLNIGDPAGCSGTVSSFTYCYYKPNSDTGSNNYTFNFAVYRETTSNTYEKVSPVFVVSRNGSSLSSNSFGCSPYTPSEPVVVETGNVLGACIFNPSGNSNELITIIGEHDYDVSMLMRNDGSELVSDCNDNSVPTTITPSSLKDSFDRVLHLYANSIMELTVNSTNDGPPTTVHSDTTTQPTEDPISGGTPSTRLSSTQPTASNTSDGNSSSNVGGVAAGVIVPLIALISIIVIVVVVVVVLLSRKRQGRTLFHSDTKMGTFGPNNNQVDGFDNEIYSSGGVDQLYQLGDSEVPTGPSPYEQTGNTATENGLLSSNVYEVPHVMDRDQTVGPQYEGISFGSDVYYSPLDTSTLIEKNMAEDIYGYGNVDPFQSPGSEEDEIYSQLKACGISALSNDNIEVEGHLGSGQFGSVERGLWKRTGTKPVNVALKSLNEGSSEEDKIKFLQEAAIMAQFRHPNVIMLYGVIARGETIKLVVELANKGDLRQHLLSLRPQSGGNFSFNVESTLLMFSQQVALGMQYLSGKGFVHRDLAARNILVSKNNVCKVADFGMSRDLADESYYVSHGGKIPVKWTAPEAIHYKKYSTASDVWAYGCLLYEIWGVGYKPFEGEKNMAVIRIVDSGERLPPPPGCPKIIYELMILCWHPETSIRPCFRDILLTLVGSEKMVLKIPVKDSSTNLQAGVLGAPLEAGENMYTDLQKRYIGYAAKTETDEDYF